MAITTSSYAKFCAGEQKAFLRKVKNNVLLTWKCLARILAINRSMIYFYLDETSKIPYDSFLKLCKLADLNPQEISHEKINVEFKGIVKLPQKITPHLAEFVGAILGDGSISRPHYQICVSMDSVLDKEYINAVIKNYFVLLFNKIPSTYYSKTSRNVRCQIYSQEVFDYLTKKLGLPFGERKYKRNNVIPKKFFRNKILLRNSLKGLFDTEGGFYQHNKTSPRLYIYNNSKYLLGSIHEALLKLGYKSLKKEKCVKICRKEEIKRFFKEIGTNNPSKLLKYKTWLDVGKTPSTKLVLSQLR